MVLWTKSLVRHSIYPIIRFDWISPDKAAIDQMKPGEAVIIFTPDSTPKLETTV